MLIGQLYIMRILVVDDEPSVLQAYRHCLETEADQSARAVDALGDSLFGSNTPAQRMAARWTGADFASQGEEAVRLVAEAVAAGTPYAMLFLDMQMPPGIDGRETAHRVRAIDADIHIVIVTGFSTTSPGEVAVVAGPDDKIFYIAKPFQTLEIRTLANALVAKWLLEHSLCEAQAALAAQLAAVELANKELAASEARCRHMALHDQLTHLPNRAAFQQFLDERIAAQSRPLAILFIDLDRFKHVNDTLGHAAGDELVVELSRRLEKTLPPTAMFARLGGDEFGIVLVDDDVERHQAIGDELIDLCHTPFTIFGSTAQVSASIGIAVRKDGEASRTTELLRRADLALYAAKGNGRNCVALFEPEHDESARKRADIEARLRVALDTDGLSLAYQPIRDPASEESVGHEALLRWTEPTLGPISPALFVPIAEESGLIIELSEWVIRTAIAECARWPSGYVSINLSTRHFQSPTMVHCLIEETARHNIPPGRVQLEITETALFDDAELAAATLVKLRDHGFRIALDDFGTGYSSLVNLKDFEIDCIKIDRSFVAKLGLDVTSTAIVQAVTSLARTLGLKVVAEGVESASQVQALRLSGCELMQGYFFGAAVASELMVFDVGERDASPRVTAGRAA